MHNGIDGESRWCVNLQFAANVASVRSHGVNREEQLVGNLLVAHATRHTRHYFTFALAQHKLWIIGCNVTIGFALIGCMAGYGLALRRGYRNLEGMNGDIAGYALTIGELCGAAVIALI